MPGSYNRWFEKLITKGWVSPVETSSTNCFRLATPIQFIVRDELVTDVLNQYDPVCEKGGVMLTAFRNIDGKLLLTVKSIVFITNCAAKPTENYQPNEEELRNTITTGFSAQLIPLIFHTHPTKSDNLLDEIKNFHLQMETSFPDRFIALGIKYRLNGKTLRLPEVLVIGNGTMRQGLFIGLYGGLVAPLGFNKQKNKRMYQWILNRAYEIGASMNSLEDIVAAGMLGFLFHRIASQNKTATKTFINQAKQILPPLVYANATQHDFSE